MLRINRLQPTRHQPPPAESSEEDPHQSDPHPSTAAARAQNCRRKLILACHSPRSKLPPPTLEFSSSPQTPPPSTSSLQIQRASHTDTDSSESAQYALHPVSIAPLTGYRD